MVLSYHFADVGKIKLQASQKLQQRRTNMAVIYKILNKSNGKYYIGSAKNFKSRKIQHITNLKSGKHCNHKLQTDWKKYGSKSFVFSVLEEVPDELQFQKEQEYLDALVDLKDTRYNINRYAYGKTGFFEPISRPCIMCGRIMKSESYNDTLCSEECKKSYQEKMRREKNCETWKHSNYEYKHIVQWDVEDHLAAYFDDRWDK